MRYLKRFLKVWVGLLFRNGVVGRERNGGMEILINRLINRFFLEVYREGVRGSFLNISKGNIKE